MYYNKSYLTAFAEKIKMPSGALETVLARMPQFTREDAMEKAAFLTAENVPAEEKEKYINRIAARDSLLPVLLYMTASGLLHEKYKVMALPEDVLYASLHCLTEKMETHMRFYGSWGYASPCWPLLALNMRLFRIGRLGYEVATASETVRIDNTLISEKGKPIIHVHISDNEKLTDCAASIDSARQFFRQYFPQKVPRVFHCYTWLLDPRLSELLPPASNIMQFQSLFTIYDRCDNARALLPRIFGTYSDDLNVYTPTSSLASAVLDYMKKGGQLGLGRGYIPF